MMNISITKTARICEYAADLGFGVSGGRAGKLQQVRRCNRDLEILERQTYHKLPDSSLERLESVHLLGNIPRSKQIFGYEV